MSKTQDPLLLVVLTSPELSQKESTLIKFAHRLSRGLGAKIEIVNLRSSSLAHYGEVDTLASFKDKNAFISYVRDLERDEEEKLDQKLHHICPEVRVNFLKKDELEQFLHVKKGRILFAITIYQKIKFPIFSKRPSFFKILEKNNINVLEIRDTSPIEKHIQAINPT